MTLNYKKKALVLSYITVIYNILEGVVSITAGYFAGSIALAGFGLDSFVESLSGMIMIRRFTGHETMSEDEEKLAENKAVRYIGYTFFIFAAYVLYESATKLYFHEKPEPSLFGIGIAIVSLITMPVLYYQKLDTARKIGSKSLIADAKETLACTMLSVSLLAGLGFNLLFGWWWADPLTGLIIVYFLVREGFEIIGDDDDDD
ncbi:MAG: cation transporter [Candidatus Latescibacteria bacterium]|nr:cation transporter [Candidatus Latescibacterota bacterium]